MEDLSLVIISGSCQVQGQSLKVAKYIFELAQKQIGSIELLDLRELDLPMIGSPVDTARLKKWNQASRQLEQSSGVVLISPEYNGGPSPAILNLMLYVKDELRRKPVLLCGVSAGRGGAAPVIGLRQFGPKDPGYFVLPSNVIVSQVGRILNEPKPVSEEDREIRKQISNNLKALFAYMLAYKGM